MLFHLRPAEQLGAQSQVVAGTEAFDLVQAVSG